MKIPRCIVVIVTLLSANLLAATPIPVAGENAEEAARMVAKMVIIGRGIVAGHQGVINDPAKGNKGFSPDYMTTHMRKTFEKKMGMSVDQVTPSGVKKALLAVLDASSVAVRNNQGRINRPGVKFKGFIPAVYGRITGNILKAKTGIGLKQTTFKYRNAYNKPDQFEAGVLKKFESGELDEGYGMRVGAKYRYMEPIYIKKACMKCHGQPKGELDIAGKVKEGYEIGDLRGAISISLPVN
ncbi:MAG: DUF3365 domain-containing protein [Sedimenticola sp.]